MTANIYLRASGPNVTYNTRSGTIVSDQNGIISTAPYGNTIVDLMHQGCVPVAPSGGSSLPWVTGRFYGSDGDTEAAVLTVLGTLYAYPVYIPTPVTLASVNMSVTTGQTGGQVRCGLYSDNGAGYPGALVTGTDSGNLTATGTAVETTGSLAVALDPGWYWLASQATASSTMPSVAGVAANYTNPLPGMLGFDTAAHALATSGQAPSGVAVTGQTYGAMPATFPASAALTLNAATPAVALGV